MEEPKLKKLINQGSFGKIYDYDDCTVIKKCNNNTFGINNLMEICIMNSFNHENINTCKDILCTEKYSYLYQEKAICDLSQYLLNNKVNKDQIKKWAYEICKGIFFLHKNNIVHADIKTDNFLIFEDFSIKITDFTFSIKLWDEDCCYNHNVCTITHRPIECLLGYSWNKSLDIWSLGCALFELYYNILLFPCQNNDKNIFKSSINSILDWVFDGHNEEIVNIPYYSVNYKKPNIPKDFYDKENELFNDLIKNMLFINPDKRINIQNILLHPYFNQNFTIPIQTKKENKFNLSIYKFARLITLKTEKLKNSKHIKNLSINIFNKVFNLLELSIEDLIETCIYISHKIINLDTYKVDNYEKCIINEIKICNLTKCNFLE